MSRDEIIQRWRAATSAAGVRLTDEDVQRIVSRGTMDRVMAVDDILARAAARETVPDYLSVMTAQSTGGRASE